MAYELYKIKKDKENYFKDWSSDKLLTLTDEIKEVVYKKYLVKCDVFKRDNYSCQNINCKNLNSPLTMHHVKFQKNGGEHKIKNCVTLCEPCHVLFHRARTAITYKNNKYLPIHIRGKTFMLDRQDKINWKEIKSHMRKLRKTLRKERIYLSWKDMNLLMKFLELNFED